MKSDRFLTTIRSTRRALFISPHLDDAILSSSALISYLSRFSQVTIATVFSNGSADLLTRFARRFVESCGFNTSDLLFRQRRKEDKDACNAINAHPWYGQQIDASMRRIHSPSFSRSMMGFILPEFLHIYPLGRSVFSGKISSKDRETVNLTYSSLASLQSLIQPDRVFCPIGIGQHVDHIMTRKIAEKVFQRIIYWSDFPYLLTSDTPSNYFEHKKMHQYDWFEGIENRSRYIGFYTSQMKGLFPDGVIPDVVERYYMS